MKNLRRIVDYATFASAINKSRRKKLVEHIRRERIDKRLPERDVQVMLLCGWYADTNPRRDEGEIRAIVKIQDIVYIIYDNLNDGKEDYNYIPIDDDIMGFIGADADAQPAAPQIVKKDGTPFAGFNGGRRKKVLTADEKAKIREMRKAGHNVNAIARELHISNRVISEFVKIEKDKR
jgi:hypothetical protein